MSLLNARPLNGLNARPNGLNGLPNNSLNFPNSLNGLPNARPNGLMGLQNARPNGLQNARPLNATSGPFSTMSGIVEGTSQKTEVDTPGGPMWVQGIETDLAYDGLNGGVDAGGLAVRVPASDGSSTLVTVQTAPQAPAPVPDECEFPTQEFDMVRDINVSRSLPTIEDRRVDRCGNILGFSERVRVNVNASAWRLDGGQTNGIVSMTNGPNGPVNGWGNQYGNRGLNPQPVSAVNANAVRTATQLASTFRG